MAAINMLRGNSKKWLYEDFITILVPKFFARQIYVQPTRLVKYYSRRQVKLIRHIWYLLTRSWRNVITMLRSVPLWFFFITWLWLGVNLLKLYQNAKKSQLLKISAYAIRAFKCYPEEWELLSTLLNVYVRLGLWRIKVSFLCAN